MLEIDLQEKQEQPHQRTGCVFLVMRMVLCGHAVEKTQPDSGIMASSPGECSPPGTDEVALFGLKATEIQS